MSVRIDANEDDLILEPNIPLLVSAECKYYKPQLYKAIIHAVNDKEDTVYRFLILINCKEPVESKTEEISCIFGKEYIGSIEYVNQYSESKVFRFISSEPAVVNVEDSEVLFKSQETRQVRLHVNGTKGLSQHYIYIYDQRQCLVGTLKLIIKAV
jgi:hypothetical protein